MAKGPARKDGTEWGTEVPRYSIPQAEKARRLADFDREAAYRAQLADDLGAIEVRLMTALHYFGMCGVPEDPKSAALRASDPDKWWQYVDRFLGLVQTWDAKMAESQRLKIRHVPDPPDLDVLIAPYLDDQDEDGLR